MDNYKSPKTTFYLSKELKNLPKPPQKENISLKNLPKKNNMKKNIFSPKQNMKQTKTKNENKEEAIMRKNEEKKEKISFKEKLKKFFKNKKLVGFVMEYIIIVECFAVIFLLTMPAQTKATTSDIEGNNTVLSSETEELENNTVGTNISLPEEIDEELEEYETRSEYYE